VNEPIVIAGVSRAGVGGGPALYANQFEIGFNAFEFLFEFGQRFEEGDAAPPAHSRLVMAPAYAKVLMRVLGQSIGEYEAAFGPIAELPGPKSP
jgi:hypothetical protein